MIYYFVLDEVALAEALADEAEGLAGGLMGALKDLQAELKGDRLAGPLALDRLAGPLAHPINRCSGRLYRHALTTNLPDCRSNDVTTNRSHTGHEPHRQNRPIIIINMLMPACQ